MKKKAKKQKRSKQAVPASEVPTWMSETPAQGKAAYSKQALDDLAANVKIGIEDTPVWKEYVRRFGEKEATKILKVGLFNEVVQGDPNN